MWFNDVIKGAGLGLRTAFIEQVFDNPIKPDWFEIAPENWIKKRGYFRKLFEKIRENFPVACHGLSLSIGSPEPVNKKFLKDLKDFLDYYEIKIYSEHLSFSYLDGKNLFELFPLPFTKEMAYFISDKINQVQDFLNRTLIIENISYYYVPYMEISETEFIKTILKKTGAKLLLDVNNVYVNSVNHGYDPYKYICSFSSDDVAYIHIAGHHKIDDNLIIDTHGNEITNEVYKLLDFTLDKIGYKPVLLERDNNIPPYNKLLDEYMKLKSRVEKYERV